MPITSNNDFLASLKQRIRIIKANPANLVIGQLWSTRYAGGLPAAAAVQAVNNGTQYGAQSPGGIILPIPTVGNIYYLGQGAFKATTGTSVIAIGDMDVYDRLTSQTMPANGIALANTLAAVALPRYSPGEMVEAFLEIQSSITTAVASTTITITYTNSAGVTGRTASIVIALPTSTIIGTMFRFPLAAGDIGVQSVQSVTSTIAGTTGVISVVLAKYVATFPMPLSNRSSPQDYAQLGLPPLTANPALQLVVVPSAAVASGSTFSGYVTLNEFVP